MPIYKRTNDNQGKVINTGGDFNKASGVIKDILHIVTLAEETSKLISTRFRYTQGINELEVYLNGQILRCVESINGIKYGDYTETSNFFITFENNVISEGDQIRFRVTSNSYDKNELNTSNILQIAKDLYGVDSNSVLRNDGSLFASGVVNVLSYGSEFDSVYGYCHEGTLNAALIDIGSEYKTLYIPKGTWGIRLDVTIPANINLRIERGAMLRISTGKILTINGSFECGLYQVFNCIGTGNVIFSNRSIRYAEPVWFGLTSFTAGIQSSLPNECFYIGTSGKLIFKDSSGVEHDLY